MLAVRIYAGLRDHNVEGTLLGTLPGWEATGLPSHRLPFADKWSRRTLVRSVIRTPRERRAALRDIEQQHRLLPFDLFHSQFKREQISLTGALSRLAPVLWTEHGVLAHDGLAARAQRRAYRHTARRSSTVACVSDVVADSVRSLGPRTRVETIPNGIDLQQFTFAGQRGRTAARRALGVQSDRLVVAWVGRLEPNKRVRLAVACVERVAGAVLLVAGSGPDQAYVEQAARRDEVHFVGFMPRPELVYQAADVFLFTGTPGEGLPTTIIESAACGLPLVATGDSNIGSIVQAAGGVLAPAEPQMLAEALAGTARIENHAGRVWAERHGIAGSVRLYADLMRSIARP